MMKKALKGLYKDTRPLDQPEGTWSNARNIVLRKGNNSISNEDGFLDVTDTTNFPTQKKFIGVIPTNTVKVVFLLDPNISFTSEIGIIDEDNVYTPVLIDSSPGLLNFSKPIKGRFEYKFNNNLIIAWTDNDNEYRILNIDCPPFEIDSSYNVTVADFNKAKALLKLFPDVVVPNISDLSIRDNGGALKTGSWYPIISYGLNDGSSTSWLKVFNPIPINLDNRSIIFNEYDGDESGIASSKSIVIDFTDVDTNYDFLNFGAIYIENGQYTAYFVAQHRISSSSLQLTFTGLENSMKTITLDSVLIPNAVYPKGKTITDLQSRLYLGNVEREVDPDYQPYANNIVVKWIRGDDIAMTDDISASYKDGKIVFFDRSFRTGEVYALYIVGVRKSGTRTSAFHIPGRAPLPNDTDVVSGLGDADIDQLGSNVKKFQVYDTALDDGTMAYWENENELYPDIADFDSSGIGGLDLRTEKVRHHKFPEIRSFVSWGDPYFHKKTPTSNIMTLDTPTIATSVGTVDSYGFVASTNTTGLTFAVVGSFNRITNGTANALGILFNGTINFSITGIGVGETATVEFDAEYLGDNTYPHQTVNVPYSATGGTGNFTGSITITNLYVNVGAIVAGVFNILVQTNTNGSGTIAFNMTGSVLNGVEQIQTDETKPLGIEISNVEIPASMLNDFDKWEIYYAKRDAANIRLIGQEIPVTGERFHSFDLLSTQAALPPSYLKPQVQMKVNRTSTYNDFVRDTHEQIPFNSYQEKVEAVHKSFYLGEAVSIPVVNTNFGTNLYITVITDPDATGSYIPDTYGLGAGTNSILVDLVIYKTDVYNSFQNQTLVFTGISFDTTGSGVQATQEIYGGDVFINGYGIIEDIANLYLYHMPVESASNIGLRIEDIVSGKYYFPKYNNASPTPPTISYYGVNSDYNVINDLNKVFPKKFREDDCTDNIYKFPQLIARSIDDGNETTILGWRTFKANEYYEMPKNRGVIWNLEGCI